ncbi:dTDP-4-dehydrorhamnose reductase [Kitasatospora sp. MAP5-34]|uniref:dTDP-4-dehydrorhamnose reductase n=1 Tax=Kitasatospora sp. MAP5-34 TaxID=3035102 RepID=UPI002476B77E|nr:dTDP-4-dehydrorhamnose reductase [Kitasatospora sp. MAP5-34]MDH6578415.1 dTDP-4-dehydrorhamnose reductase [Kitasatospora sp. MAP5-34]
MTPGWLVTGSGGMLGRDLLTVLAGEQVTALDRAALDITDPAAVRAAVAGHSVVVNCAAWTDVDGAETAEEAATAVNGTGVRHLAAACAETGARLLHVSTDYVLPGDAGHPYPEDAATGPVNAYGRSKLAGERAVAELLPEHGYIVRTAWLYGEHGGNFVATMLKLAAQRETLDVVDDQQGQPTWSYALAQRLVALGRAPEAPAGVYHGTASGRTTWYGLARAAYELSGLDPERIRPTNSAAFVRPAVRPAYSVLGHDRWATAGLPPLPDWRESLAEALGRPAFTALAPKDA